MSKMRDRGMGVKDKMDRNYLLNIKTGKIHSAKHPCARAKRMDEANKKYFEDYEKAVDYFEGKIKKGEPCVLCFPEKQ